MTDKTIKCVDGCSHRSYSAAYRCSLKSIRSLLAQYVAQGLAARQYTTDTLHGLADGAVHYRTETRGN